MSKRKASFEIPLALRRTAKRIRLNLYETTESASKPDQSLAIPSIVSSTQPGAQISTNSNDNPEKILSEAKNVRKRKWSEISSSSYDSDDSDREEIEVIDDQESHLISHRSLNNVFDYSVSEEVPDEIRDESLYDPADHVRRIGIQRFRERFLLIIRFIYCTSKEPQIFRNSIHLESSSQKNYSERLSEDARN